MNEIIDLDFFHWAKVISVLLSIHPSVPELTSKAWEKSQSRNLRIKPCALLGNSMWFMGYAL